MIAEPFIQTLIGGVVLVGAGFGAWWMWLQKYQARIDPAHGGALPTCESFLDTTSTDLTKDVLGEYRIYQAQHPADNSSNPATLRQGSPPDPGVPSTQPGSDAGASDERADQAVPYAPQTKSGSSAPNVGPRPGPEPTPQRANSDGRVYSKAPAYVDSYNEKK